jgi:uncharacterized protein (TIGR03382 family)
MWAWRRVQRLLKDADRTGSREQAVSEVVRLGEAFAIATEYTSFLVLENDAEYRRWKIERRNLLLLARDREALDARRAAMEKLRQKVVTGLGPEAAHAERPAAAPAQQVARPNASARSTPSAPPPQGRRGGRSADLPWGSGSGGSGSGPVGPLFAAAAVWLARRRRSSLRRQADANER